MQESTTAITAQKKQKKVTANSIGVNSAGALACFGCLALSAMFAGVNIEW